MLLPSSCTHLPPLAAVSVTTEAVAPLPTKVTFSASWVMVTGPATGVTVNRRLACAASPAL